jgi:hypothetical protein
MVLLAKSCSVLNCLAIKATTKAVGAEVVSISE